MDSYIFGFFALAYIGIFVWGLMKHKKTTSAILLLVVLALIYDNFILAIGSLIGEGLLLESLSYVRFWLHALLTPTLILFSLFVMREAGIHFVKKRWALYGFAGLTLLAILVEYFVELQGLTLGVRESYGVVSYSSSSEASGPPPMILIVLVGLFTAAITLAKEKKWWWMLIGTVVMTIGGAMPITIGSDALTNAFELFLIVILMWTGIHFSNNTTQ